MLLCKQRGEGHSPLVLQSFTGGAQIEVFCHSRDLPIFSAQAEVRRLLCQNRFLAMQSLKSIPQFSQVFISSPLRWWSDL